MADLYVGTGSDAEKGACAFIRAYCGWHIAPSAAEVLTVDGPGQRFLGLPSMRVTAVTSIVQDGTMLLENVDYEWSASGYLNHRRCWTSKLRGVVVSLTHGYDACPADLVQVIGRLEKSGQFVGFTSAAVNGVAVSLAVGADGLDPFVATILDHYRIPSA